MAEKDNELKEKYYEMKAIEEHLQNLNQQAQAVDSQLDDLRSSVRSLREYEKLKDGDTVLLPLCSGVFAKAKLQDSSGLYVNVGANTVVKKNPSGTLQLLEKQFSEMQELHLTVISQLQRLANHAKTVEEELNALAAKAE
ncbi:prefoldin subunit alpha [Candidatus Woesearchaeota archaeon]|nr:prefoldin subunit alpha [Candidatus Woesearchaeota archaeon]